MMSELVQGEYKSEVRLEMGSMEAAEIFKQCMEVDEELQPTKISRSFSIEEESIIVVKFVSTDPKVLRVAMSSFYDMAIVSCKTLLAFP